MKTELEQLYRQIEKSKTAMLTTKRSDGHLSSRPMANQKEANGADLWFVTYDGAAKLAELERDPHVNLAYLNSSNNEWVSVAGIAKISKDKETIAQLFAADWRMWFPREGDPRHGTKDDPRIVLIGVDVHAATFLEVNKPKPVVLFELVKGFITGTMPDLGEVHHVDEPASAKH